MYPSGTTGARRRFAIPLAVNYGAESTIVTFALSRTNSGPSVGVVLRNAGRGV
jgi:hypothetical protein